MESGLWKSERRKSHKFLLSPNVYHLTQKQYQELYHLGIALYDCLLGLSHIAVIAYDKKLNYNGTWRFTRKIFSAGVPKIYEPLQGMNIKDIPKLLKIDLIIDQNGQFKIVEIDGHNKHGLGYSTLTKKFRQVLYPSSESKELPGIIPVLAQEIKKMGYDEIKMLYSNRERFYLPEFEIAQQEFSKHGINCLVISEIKVKENFLRKGLFLDLPFLQRKELYATIIKAYENKNVSFIIPPKPFLGGKNILAFLRNDSTNEGIEALLLSFIKKSSLEKVRGYIPPTFLIGKQVNGKDILKKQLTQKRFVLKESISSGMKRIIFSDEKKFPYFLSQAKRDKVNWILQEEINNLSQTFSWFEEKNNPELKSSNNWFTRLIVQYANRKLGDVTVTACQDKAVHGGKSCLFLGTTVE